MNQKSDVLIDGNLLGLHVDQHGAVFGEVVQILDEARPQGPAESAFVYIDKTDSAGPRARYLSWINLYDIENASRRQPGQWQLVEPLRRHAARARWLPFGWGAPAFPSVADIVPEPAVIPG
jgi:hypothetical protein